MRALRHAADYKMCDEYGEVGAYNGIDSPNERSKAPGKAGRRKSLPRASQQAPDAPLGVCRQNSSKMGLKYSNISSTVGVKCSKSDSDFRHIL